MKLYTKKICTAGVCIIMIFLLLAACTSQRRPEGIEKEPELEDVPKDRVEKKAEKPEIPKQLEAKSGEEPRIRVYIHEQATISDMEFEEYVAGVVGGEIKNDWPEEAIKAQAIIARTFVLQFIDEKGGSKYEGAHISTDIEEAQAWNQEEVNDRIKKAVEDTRGQVMVHKGKYVKAWFHSNAGGMTATAKEGLNYKDGNPDYIQVVKSPDDSPHIPERHWTAVFNKAKVITAIRDAGEPMENFSKVSLGPKGPSGRAMTIVFDETEVPAPELRIALGSTELKSTLLDEVRLEGNKVIFKGRGYGHGVGMSQWGAYSMAKEGKKAEDIIAHYFKDVDIVKLWK